MLLPLLFLVTSGCLASVQFTRDQLWALAGLPEGGTRTLLTQNGPFTFHGNLPVSVVTPGGALPPAPLHAMRVVRAEDGDALSVDPPGGTPALVKRADVVRGEAEGYAAGRTLGAVSGIAFGAATAIACAAGFVFLLVP